MILNRKTAIIIAVLFLAAIIPSMIGDGLIKSITESPDYLSNIYMQKIQLLTGIFLQLACAVAVVFIAVVLYPILKNYNKNIALGYLSFRVIESAIIFVSAISLLLLLTLSQEYANMESKDVPYFNTLGNLAVKGHYWAFQTVIIICAIAGSMLCYSLYQSRLIPRFISILGLVGYPLSLLAAILDMYGVADTFQSPGVLLYIPGSIFEIILLPAWLIFKGFNQSVIACEQANEI